MGRCGINLYWFPVTSGTVYNLAGSLVFSAAREEIYCFLNEQKMRTVYTGVRYLNKMAKEYYEKLSNLLNETNIENEISLPIEVKHFFSGAALYVNNKIRVSWSPVGLAFKLPELEVEKLIKNGKARPLKYFPDGHVKKGYALFENPGDKQPEHWKKYLITSARQV